MIWVLVLQLCVGDICKDGPPLGFGWTTHSDHRCELVAQHLTDDLPHQYAVVCKRFAKT